MAGRRARVSGILDEANNKYHSALDRGKHAIDEGKERIRSKLGRGKQELHGTLLIEILSAKDLPDMDNKWLIKLNKNDLTDAYVEVRLNNACLARTNVVHNSLNPVWNETYRFDVCHSDSYLTFHVLDKDDLNSEMIGTVEFKIKDILDGEKREGEYTIRKQRHLRDRGKLKLMVKFVPISRNKKTFEVDSYFPVQQNCRVTLYQDAHVEPDMKQFKDIKEIYYPRSCWTDIYESLIQAKKLIVIVGWSVWHELKLLRSKNDGNYIDDRSLGDILVEKATKDGVTVYIMLWGEYSGGAVGETFGMSMGTGGNDTYNFFQKKGVPNIHCILVPRTKFSEGFWDDWFVDKFQNATYTHHQKTVICDANCADSNRRRLVAYLGGLDLTNGRWDTPDHELFSTLEYQHKGDFLNAMIHPRATTYPNLEKEGPREPWHDIHCKVEGKIAYDVFRNFRERWFKQGKNEIKMDLSGIPLRHIDSFDIEADGTKDEKEIWNCQLFRSINESSVCFNLSRSTNYDQENNTLINKLSRKSGIHTESSIMQAYIQAIRNAENFIYIENQYFLGSSYCWKLHDHEIQTPNKSCQHIIPAEIAQKIVEKVHSKSRFVAYILVPMFPEGDPTSLSVQEILYWQYRTMEMMYKKVSEAIEDAGSDTIPTDWLVFMCLGKQELSDTDHNSIKEPTNVFAKNLHFPIYVHSKMMIVDDAYIIVGSANINQRSMAGSRDSEIAVGAWQPNNMNDHPKGEIHGFRLGLFCEHFKHFDEIFTHPEDLNSVRKIKDILRCNWASYSGQVHDSNLNWSAMKGKPHGNILSYPIEVKCNGSLTTINDIESFPDYPLNATIKGKFIGISGSMHVTS